MGTWFVMIESFPFGRTADYLEDDDFFCFANRYTALVKARIPSAGSVYFVARSGTAPKLSSDPRQGAEISTAIQEMLRGVHTSLIVADNILLSLRLKDDLPLVIIVSKVDELVLLKCAPDWLEDTRLSLSREFVEVKQSCRDPETGLLNSAHLFSLLQTQSAAQRLAVVLVELPPQSRVLKDAFRNAQRAAATLIAFADNRFLVHHLGQCVFALIATVSDFGSIERFSSRLVQYLKKEGFFRVHIGSSQQGTDDIAEGMLDQAWTALQTARGRGPFSFCEFSALANTSTHPLRSVSADIVKVFHRLSRADDRFCLVKFNTPEISGMASGMRERLNLPESASILGEDRGPLVYLSGYEAEQGVRFAESCLEQFPNRAGESEVYAGVSAFPFRGFSKADTLANTQKAMLHAAFYGAGHAVVFDAVSLNVSGDIYFSDGDLPRAVREYRLGLSCEPKDVNLLNSLGVAYALLNKNALARATFENVLEIDRKNYMALYNLGLGAQLRSDLPEALECFEKALRYSTEETDDIEFSHDLRLQLGQLYCQTGNYEKSLQYLDEWRAEKEPTEQGRILKYLGEAYLGCGMPKEAMTWLQRALRHNEFDHDILSLLGTAVWQAREGDDIALSLCGKSVDLAPADPHLRLRLARVQLHTGLYEEALASLGKCRGKGVEPVEVQLLKAAVYQQLQRTGKARFWAKKVQQRCAAESEPYRKAQVLLESLS